MKILLEPKDTLIFNRKLTCSPDGKMSKQATLARVEEYEGQKVLVTLPMSKLEVPDNVNSFEKMELHYLDANVLEVLQKLRHLFTDVHLFLKSSNEKKARQVLQHLMPLVSSIDSIYLCQQETYNFLLDRFPSTMYNTKVLQHLCGQFQQRINIDAYYNWLIHKRDDGNPKMLLLANIGVEQLGAFLQTIHERFLAAQDNEGPVSFFVRVEHFHRRPNDIVEQTVVNSATGEQLVVKIIQHPNHPESLLITRWPINVSEAEEQELAINWHCFFSGKHIMVDPVECDLKEGDQEQQEATASGCSDHSSLASADGSTATNDLKTKKGHV